MSPKTTQAYEEMIRDVEVRLLDQEFKRFDFLKHSEEVCILHILKAYGDLFRDLTNFGNNYTRQSAVTMLHLSEHAVGHCLRWIVQENKEKPTEDANHLSELGSKRLDKEAAEFLQFGVSYSKLFADHVAWSRKQLNAHVNQEEKHIWFTPLEDLDWKFFESQLKANERISLSYGERFPVSPDVAEFRSFVKNFKIRDKQIDAQIDIYNTIPFKNLLTFFASEIFPSLEATYNFGGYTLHEFRTFAAGFTLYGLYGIWLENIVDSRLGDENPLGSLSVGQHREEVLSFFNSISGLDVGCVANIIKDLTFESTNIHSMLANQPFISGRNEMIYYAPRIIGNHPPFRILSGALNKTSKRTIYESIVEHLQNRELDNIETLLKTLGLTVIREREIKFGKQKIKPDLIVFDAKNPDVLIIDYKHSLSPLGPSEVLYRMSDIKGAISQVNRYVETLRSNTGILEGITKTPTHSRNIHGIVLYRWPMVVLMKMHPTVKLIDWPTLHAMITNAKNVSTKEIYLYARDRPDIAFDSSKLQQHKQEVRVQDWKYTHVYYSLG